MTRTLTVIGSIFVLAIALKASGQAESPASLEAKRVAAAAKIAQVEATVPNLEQRVKELEGQIAQANLDSQGPTPGAKLSAWWNGEVDPAAGEKQKARDAARERVKTLTTELATAKKAVTDARAQIRTEKVDFGATQAATTQQVAALAQEIRGLSVTSSLDNLTARVKDANYVLDQIENHYDQALIGAYVQDKIGQLVNSNTMCKAVSRCQIKDPKKIDAKEIKDELFPSSKSTRSEYYDKVKARRDAKTSK